MLLRTFELTFTMAKVASVELTETQVYSTLEMSKVVPEQSPTNPVPVTVSSQLPVPVLKATALEVKLAEGAS